MYQYVIMFTGIQYVSILSHIHGNSILSYVLHLQQLNMYRYFFTFTGIQYVSIGSYDGIQYVSIRFMQKISTYRYVLVFKDFNSYRQFLVQ
jgi:hypothetical protein